MTFAARKIGTAETGSPEWHALRTGKMTGSRIAAAAGISPWQSAFNLYYQMLGMVPEQIEDNEDLEWGRRLEPVVIQKYVDSNPHVKVRTKVGVWQNKEREYQVASPDGFITDPGAWAARRRPDGILEAKTARYSDGWGPTGTDLVPIYYRAQIIWYLDTCGLRYADCCAFFGNRDYREYRIEWDEEDAEFLRDAATTFLARVARQDRPDIDGSESTFRTIQKFHPDIDGNTIDVPADIAADLVAAREEAEYAQAELTRNMSVLQEYMGTAKVAQVVLDDGSTLKLADRRAKGEGQPYMQLASVKAHVTKLSQLRKAS